MRKFLPVLFLFLIFAVVLTSCRAFETEKPTTEEPAPSASGNAADPSTTTKGDRRVDPFNPDPTEEMTEDPAETNEEVKTGEQAPASSGNESGAISTSSRKSSPPPTIGNTTPQPSDNTPQPSGNTTPQPSDNTPASSNKSESEVIPRITSNP